MPTIDNEARLEVLRTERNRFLAFTFAAPDLALEIGRDGTIADAAAVGHWLGG